jgi:hypothetical protein
MVAVPPVNRQAFPHAPVLTDIAAITRRHDAVAFLKDDAEVRRVLREELRRAVATLSATLGVPAQPPAARSSTETLTLAPLVPPPAIPDQETAANHVLLVPGDRYTLVEGEGRAPEPATTVQLEDRDYRVVRHRDRAVLVGGHVPPQSVALD